MELPAIARGKFLLCASVLFCVVGLVVGIIVWQLTEENSSGKQQVLPHLSLYNDNDSCLYVNVRDTGAKNAI